MAIECKFEKGFKAKPRLRHATAGVILENDAGEIFLTKRSLEMPTEPGKWTLPAGYMEAGERFVEAAERECLEETGYKVEVTGVVCFTDDPDRPDNNRQNVGVIFSAKVIKKVGEPDDESTETRWFKNEELPSLAFEYEAVLERYKKNGSLPVSSVFLLN